MTTEHETNGRHETVRIDPVMQAVGIGGTLEGESGMSDEIVERLVPSALAFLRGGGSWTWREWRELSIPTQRAFVMAGERMRAEGFASLAAAIRDPDVMQALADGTPVEDVKNDRALEEAVNRVASEHGPKVPG